MTITSYVSPEYLMLVSPGHGEAGQGRRPQFVFSLVSSLFCLQFRSIKVTYLRLICVDSWGTDQH